MTGVHLAGESDSEAGSGQKVTAALIISKWAKHGQVVRGRTEGPGHVTSAKCLAVFALSLGDQRRTSHTANGPSKPMDSFLAVSESSARLERISGSIVICTRAVRIKPRSRASA